MAKDLTEFKWIEELLPPGFERRPLFGGFAYYLGPKIMLAIFESEGDREFKGQVYPFEIWNGCLFPVERESHKTIKAQHPELIPHPVLSKWLYLPGQTEDFESQLASVFREIKKGSPLFGVIPKPKKRKKPSKRALSTRKPQMFSED